MGKSVFRKASLDRLSSPEQLDQIMTVTTPRAWLALLAIGAMVAAALAWGVFGSIPSKTYGQGILLTSGGVHSVTHSRTGRITDIRVDQGDLVRQGDVVARVEQQEIVDEINRLKRQLSELERVEESLPQYQEAAFQAELYELYELTRQLEDAQARVAIMEATYNQEAANAGLRHIELRRAQIALEEAQLNRDRQQREVDRLQTLQAAGAIPQNQLETAQIQLQVLDIELERAQQQVEAFPLQEQATLESLNTQQAQLDQARLQVTLLERDLEDRQKRLASSNALEIVNVRRNIEALQQDLLFASNVLAPVSGRVLETRVSRGDLVQPGAPLFSIVQEGSDLSDLQGVLYVPAAQGKQILPGMEAQISPGVVKKEEFGYMLGRVVSVSEYPATAQGMMLTLGNQELVNQLAGQGAPIEVRIELVINQQTPSGYQWSTPQGPPMVIDSGTIASGSITVSAQQPIRMIIPTIRKYLPFD